MSYYQFKDDDGNEYGSFEVFYDIGFLTLTGKPVNEGYYWWACWPGCMPDGEPSGPFKSEELAIADALND
jgi:hypothetical protein